MLFPHLWYALQISTRCSGLSEKLLLQKGYDVFVPKYMTRTRRSNALTESPLFPSYLFCRITSYSYGKILGTPGVIRVVGYGHTPVAIPDSEIDCLAQLASSPVLTMPCAYIPAGTTVRIETGPLRGLEGLLVRAGNARKLIVSVSLLRRSIAATLDVDTMLTPLIAADLRSNRATIDATLAKVDIVD